MGRNDPPQPLPDPTPDEEKKAKEEVEDWLKKHDYPSPDPDKQ